MNRIKEKYRKEVIPALREEFGYKNIMSVPKIDKVVINVGIGRIAKEAKLIQRIQEDLAKLTGQKSSIRKATKSIAGFKLREGMNVGLITTLRSKRMYDFIDRFISIALPRSRDFYGIDPKYFDKNGNLNIGIREHTIFPEISYESAKDIFGLQITVTTTANNLKEGLSLLTKLGFPMKKVENKKK